MERNNQNYIFSVEIDAGDDIYTMDGYTIEYRINRRQATAILNNWIRNQRGDIVDINGQHLGNLPRIYRIYCSLFTLN